MIWEEVVYFGVDPSKLSEGMGSETGKWERQGKVLLMSGLLLGASGAQACQGLSDCRAASEPSHWKSRGTGVFIHCLPSFIG